ncbi:MAG: caspase family protein [Campylobacterota bacterium]|nr:caspase family protein [Campylobacterota bacterium]
MKKRALIIGNAGNEDEFLLGVSKDVNNYKRFLLSNIGGNWYESEISISLDETKKEVEAKIRQVKNEKNDFIFIVFTGHGSYSRLKQCRKLYINYDYIYESDLLHSSNKQITIIDTCAGIEDDLLLEINMESYTADSIRKNASIDNRIVYENDIRQCLRQQNILYACDIDETSADTSKGGLFSYHLIETAKNNKFEQILDTQKAYIKTDYLVQSDPRTKQNPQYFNSCRSYKRLPFSVKG